MAKEQAQPEAGAAKEPAKGTAPKGRVLVVDDEQNIREIFQWHLEAAGFQAETAADGKKALERLSEDGGFDAIVSDINMPGLDGVELLKAVREKDLDLPLIFVTGAPALETAMDAVEHGAFRYLSKPVEAKVLRETVERAIRLRKMAVLKREALKHLGLDRMQAGDLATMEGAFARGLSRLWMAYQPIVRWPVRQVYAYEALVRTEERSIPHPGVFLDMAERLGRLRDLGRSVRDAVGEVPLAAAGEARLFVNLRAGDLSDEEIYSPAAPLSRMATRVVLEITEREALDGVNDARDRVRRLKAMGFRVAIDDLGAGYAGLSSFAALEPDIVKIDMSLVRGLEADPVKRRIVASMAALCREMGTEVVAEGVETPAERDAVAAAGCTLQQGFLFARPDRPFPEVRW